MQEKNVIFEVKEHLGVISKYETGWTKELNIVSWNGSASKYDIRDWDSTHERMSRGVTLHPTEMRTLVDLYINANNKKSYEHSTGKGGYAAPSEEKKEDTLFKEKDEDIPFEEENQEETAFDASPLVDEKEPASEDTEKETEE